MGRLTNWLGFILEEEVFWKDSTTAQHEARLRFLLSKLIDFGRANNVRPPLDHTEASLLTYLRLWASSGPRPYTGALFLQLHRAMERHRPQPGSPRYISVPLLFS